MTDNEIIKILTDYGTQCKPEVISAAISLINRQQAEIERLKIENQSLRGAANSYKLHYNKARTEAVKEFVERLKARIIEDFLEYNTDTTIGYIDNLVKEMVGEDK